MQSNKCLFDQKVRQRQIICGLRLIYIVLFPAMLYHIGKCEDERKGDANEPLLF